MGVNGRWVSRLLCCGDVFMFYKKQYYAKWADGLLLMLLRLYCGVLFNVRQLQIVDEDKRLDSPTLPHLNTILRAVLRKSLL